MSHPSYGLGRIFVPDERDNSHLMSAHLPTKLRLPIRNYIQPGPVLNQGNKPYCVAFGTRQFLVSPPGFLATEEPTTDEIYAGAQANDDIDGPPPEYDGTTVRGAMSYLSKRGLLKEYVWANNLDDVREWILLGKGLVVVGFNWYERMFTPDENHVIHVGGKQEGGHCFDICGADDEKEAFRMVNSWGTDWSDNGQAWLTYADFERLLGEDGEAATAVEVAGA